MSVENVIPVEQKVDTQPRKKAETTLSRVLKYTAVRVVVLFLTVVVAVFLTIIIANMGGYLDIMQKANIRETISMQAATNPAVKNLDPAERTKWIDGQILIQEKRLGLDQPFIVRTARF